MYFKIKPLAMTTLLAAFLLFNSSKIYAQTNQHEDLVGMWDLIVTIEGFDEYSTFWFEVKNDTLTGVWTGDLGQFPILDVSFVQDTLWGQIVIEEAGLDITIIGVVSNGTMKGKGLSQMSELFPFTATKRKKDF